MDELTAARNDAAQLQELVFQDVAYLHEYFDHFEISMKCSYSPRFALFILFLLTYVCELERASMKEDWIQNICLSRSFWKIDSPFQNSSIH